MQKKFWVIILLQYLFFMSVFSQEIIYRVKKELFMKMVIVKNLKWRIRK